MSIADFVRVPVDSTVEVGLEGPPGGTLEWDLIAGEVDGKAQGTLQSPGIQSSGLLKQSKRTYGLMTRIRFTDDSEVTLLVRVRRPDNSIYRTDRELLKGKTGDRDGLLVIVKTRREAQDDQ